MMEMLRNHIKDAIQVALLLSLFAGSEQMHVKDTTTTFRSLDDRNLNSFQCRNVTPKIMKPKIHRDRRSEGLNNGTDFTRCRKACNDRSDCIGYFFNKDESTCTRYLSLLQSELQNSSTQYCAKTADILENDKKYSCVYGNKWSTKFSYRKCFKKCKKSKACYGFAYDKERKICDRFMRKKAKPSRVRSNGSRCDDISRIMNDDTPKCPCFNAGDIDSVVSDLIDKKAKANFETQSCERYGDDELFGINYRYAEENLSFSVSGADANGKGFCVTDDTTKSVTTEENGQCLALLQGGCKTLQDRKVDLGRCPCFNEEKLVAAVKEIKNGSKVVAEGTCTSNAAGNSIDFFYEDPSSTWPWPTVEGYSIYVSSIIDSRRCTFEGDMMVPGISEKSASDCFSLIQNACKQIL